jgi:hypothetical protein
METKGCVAFYSKFLQFFRSKNFNMKHLATFVLVVALFPFVFAHDDDGDHVEQYKEICGLQDFAKTR